MDNYTTLKAMKWVKIPVLEVRRLKLIGTRPFSGRIALLKQKGRYMEPYFAGWEYKDANNMHQIHGRFYPKQEPAKDQYIELLTKFRDTLQYGMP